MTKVTYIFPISHHFRYPFHVKLREKLSLQAIEYRFVYSAPFGVNVEKKDTVEVPWGSKVPLLRLSGIIFQSAFKEFIQSDIVIIQQENKLFLNYVIQILGLLGLKKVAFFGHGRNFQARNANSFAERWKRFWATKVNWWFAYTDETKRYLVSIGFSEDRITVFNNSIDTADLVLQASLVTPEQLAKRRMELGLLGSNVCVYVGGLYADKRPEFLVEALDHIRGRVPDFEFLVVGGGDELDYFKNAASRRPWLKVTGPKFGPEKVELMALGKLFLIPGLVGLAILDAGVMGLPVVTTDYPFHSPEIAYLEDGTTGIVSSPWTDVAAYSNAVVDLLTGDSERLQKMALAARQVAAAYSIEQMAERFAQGVIQALER